MSPEKYNRSIELLCPTCGTSSFSQSTGNPEAAEEMICASCGLEISRENLIKANRENIDEHVKEIGREVTGDIKRELAKAFRGSKFIKFK
ncbi:hypothetical protein [Luteimonas sp. YGD11-2]|uniref:ECs_2282 family putative zinc-binding protein n=1 Tax=Luteimonas sp. YGD11-2 TaxID=2508168 RepID=UPI00100B4640|nr:hypothetical protein [Luteimonas sp. YGD11-2]